MVATCINTVRNKVVQTLVPASITYFAEIEAIRSPIRHKHTTYSSKSWHKPAPAVSSSRAHSQPLLTQQQSARSKVLLTSTLVHPQHDTCRQQHAPTKQGHPHKPNHSIPQTQQVPQTLLSWTLTHTVTGVAPKASMSSSSLPTLHVHVCHTNSKEAGGCSQEPI
jgi:hypothetical protein